MSLRKLFSAALSVACIVASALVPAAHAQVRDSTNVLGASALPLSNCTNISGTWYAAGQVPAGYYKQTVSPYDCKPIPACAGNQVFSTSSETCGCPAGTTWDASYGTCHAACSAGTAWNGSSCASICSGGQTWNGSTCACPAGQAWNGTTCGAIPVISGFSMSPATQTVGSNYTLAWNVSGASSLSFTCTGATSMTGALSPLTSGSGTIAASAPGTTTCTVKATNAYGSSTAADSSTASCAAGTTWNGSSCASVCSGGQTWNGSACVCPAGQVSNGTSCGAPAVFGSFSLSPAATNVGSPYSVAWTTAGTSPVTVTMNCSGATAASYTLSPSAGGTGSLAANAPGTTNCTATAANPWGSSSAADSGTAACPQGTVWNSSTSSCLAAALTSATVWLKLYPSPNVVYAYAYTSNNPMHAVSVYNGSVTATSFAKNYWPAAGFIDAYNTPSVDFASTLNSSNKDTVYQTTKNEGTMVNDQSLHALYKAAAQKYNVTSTSGLESAAPVYFPNPSNPNSPSTTAIAASCQYTAVTSSVSSYSFACYSTPKTITNPFGPAGSSATKIWNCGGARSIYAYTSCSGQTKIGSVSQ